MVTQEKEPLAEITERQKDAIWREFKAMKKGQKDALVTKLMWKILMENGGQISLPFTELMNIDERAALQSVVIPESGVIVFSAGYMEQKNHVIKPEKKIGP